MSSAAISNYHYPKVEVSRVLNHRIIPPPIPIHMPAESRPHLATAWFQAAGSNMKCNTEAQKSAPNWAVKPTPTLAMASPSSWPVLVPSALAGSGAAYLGR